MGEAISTALVSAKERERADISENCVGASCKVNILFGFYR
jgi:hypothetical protein